MARVEKKVSRNYARLVEFEAEFRNSKKEKTRKDKAAVFNSCIKKCDFKRAVLGYFPIVDTLIHYEIKESLPNDIISGLIVGIMMIPQGLAYAVLSTLPSIVGLYLSFFASITYFVFGTSRHLSWGCVAIVSLIVADVLHSYDHSVDGLNFIKNLNLSHQVMHISDQKLPGFIKIPSYNGLGEAVYTLPGNSSQYMHYEILEIISARRIEIACGLSVLSGLIVIVASQIGLSRITILMSNSLITGFTVGIAFHVASSQFKDVLGISVKRHRGTGRLFRLWFDIIQHLPETNLVVFLLTIISILVIYSVKKFVNERYKDRMRIPVPIELIVVIVGILVSSSLHLHEDHDVEVVGKVPIGLPKPKFPDLSLVTNFIGDALIIIIVAHAQSLAMAKTLGMEYSYPIDTKQEMFAIGLSTFVCGLFSGFTPCASISRSLVQSGSGGKTQLASLFAAGLVLLVIMVIGPYFYNLPTCIMSAIILVNVRGMFLKLLTIPSEWRKSRHDCCVWVFACVVTIVLDTGLALLLSVGFSVFLVLIRHVIGPVVEIGKIYVNEQDIELRSLENYSSVHATQCTKLIKVKNPLYFLNSETFTNAVFEITQINPIHIKSFNSIRQSTESKKTNEGTPILKETKDSNENEDVILTRLNNLKTLVFDISEVSFLDTMGVHALDIIVCEYQSVGVHVLVCSVPENVFGILQSTGFWTRHKDKLFLSVQSAITHLDHKSEKNHVDVQDSKF